MRKYNTVKMSSSSFRSAMLATWRIESNRVFPVVINSFDEVRGRAIQDEFGDVYAVPFPELKHYKAIGE